MKSSDEQAFYLSIYLSVRYWLYWWWRWWWDKGAFMILKHIRIIIAQY